MVPFGSLSTDMGRRGDLHRPPLCEWRRETAWSVGDLGSLSFLPGRGQTP